MELPEKRCGILFDSTRRRLLLLVQGSPREGRFGVKPAIKGNPETNTNHLSQISLILSGQYALAFLLEDWQRGQE